MPSELGISRDHRPLGVPVAEIALCQRGRSVAIAADDGRLAEGFHGYEPTERLRWTNGEAALPEELWSEFADDAIEIALTLKGRTLYWDDGKAPERKAA